jgi:hypothetical protein
MNELDAIVGLVQLWMAHERECFRNKLEARGDQGDEQRWLDAKATLETVNATALELIRAASARFAPAPEDIPVFPAG